MFEKTLLKFEIEASKFKIKLSKFKKAFKIFYYLQWKSKSVNLCRNSKAIVKIQL